MDSSYPEVETVEVRNSAVRFPLPSLDLWYRAHCSLAYPTILQTPSGESVYPAETLSDPDRNIGLR